MAHNNSISYEGIRNAGKMSLRRQMCLPGMALEQAFHDHEGFYIVFRSKPFAIMEKQWKRGQPIGPQREPALPGTWNEQAN